METRYVDGTKTKEQFETIDELEKSAKEKMKNPNVKKIIITFPKRKIPSNKK